MTWQVCGMLSDILFFKAGSSTFSLGAPCWLKIQSHGPIETGRFFENPLVGRHVENSLRIANMAFWVWCSLIHNWITRWAPCRECLLFKRLRDMVLVSGQNEVLLVLLSFFWCWETMLVSRAVTAVGRHVLWLIVKYMDLLKPVGFSKTH